MKTIITTAAVVAEITTSAHAYTDTYMCRVPGDQRGYPVTLDSAAKFAADGKGTLRWRGTTFRNLRMVEGCAERYQATHNGVTADICMSNQGGAALTIGEASFECKLKW
ncbi:MAG: hypothetical protein JO283_17305 [Bradyrhizobium sp.]|nr:hypothetical protein [Bradyrhizobium sp.]